MEDVSSSWASSNYLSLIVLSRNVCFFAFPISHALLYGLSFHVTGICVTTLFPQGAILLLSPLVKILRRCGDSVELVDVSRELPQLVRRPGLRTWKVRCCNQNYLFAFFSCRICILTASFCLCQKISGGLLMSNMPYKLEFSHPKWSVDKISSSDLLTTDDCANFLFS